jgi:hypothetical protein
LVDSGMEAFHIAIGTEMQDIQRGGPLPYHRSKLGGNPFVENAARCGGTFEGTTFKGFRQLVQFDTPRPQAEGHVTSFPFDPGWLHVLCRGEVDGGLEFAFVVQQ